MRSLKISPQITNRESESFVIYLQEITKLNKKENLTIEEEVELAERIKKGDKKAEKELIERNLRFVISVAKQHKFPGSQLGDLVNEGNIGLIKAARKFDATRGCKFISYAVWWVRQSILCYLNDNSRTVRIPLNRIGQLSKIKKIENKLEQTLQRKPTPDEIIDELDFQMSVEDIDKLFLADKDTQSLDSQISSNKNSKTESFTLEDFLVDNTEKSAEDKLEAEDLKKIVKQMINRMPLNHRTVIEMYYGLNGNEPKTLDEISYYLNLTRERIRQIKNTALIFMSNSRNKKTFQQYMK